MELHRGICFQLRAMFGIINYYSNWLASMQLARRENKAKHKSAYCILRATGWVVVIA